jgi:NAD(P)-dependent dehydrogenase (short-subunit alcohol dehydrogenase family)
MTENPSPSDSFSLEGRVAVITGGTRGIGLALAHGFAAQGARVVVASRKPEACAAAEAELGAAGAEALGVPTHLGRQADLAGLVSQTVDRFGSVDVLVNNAANALAMPLDSVTDEAFDKSFDVNVKGPVFLVQRSLPYLQQSGHAAVINVLSAGAFTASPGKALYAACKAAMLSFTRSMAAEFADLGIRVNALAPGSTDTDMTRNTGPEAYKRMAQSSPLRRIAEPAEMVGAALLLASDAGSYITGACINVDGGLIPPR